MAANSCSCASARPIAINLKSKFSCKFCSLSRRCFCCCRSIFCRAWAVVAMTWVIGFHVVLQFRHFCLRRQCALLAPSANSARLSRMRPFLSGSWRSMFLTIFVRCSWQQELLELNSKSLSCPIIGSSIDSFKGEQTPLTPKPARKTRHSLIAQNIPLHSPVTGIFQA